MTKRPVFDEHGQLIGWDVLQPVVFTVNVGVDGCSAPPVREPGRYVFEPLTLAIDDSV